MIVHGEALCKFDLLYADVENTDTSLNVGYLLKDLAWYSFPVNLLSKKKRAMLRCMKNHAV